MKRAIIELAPDVLDRTRAILEALPVFEVRNAAKQNALQVGEATWPLLLAHRVQNPLSVAAPDAFAAMAHPDMLAFAVAERIPDRARRELEAAGCAYADGTGAVHVDVAGIYVHVEGRTSRRSFAVPPPAGVGVTGVRVVQELLREPNRPWSVPDLAEAAACSIGEAHRVLVRLEKEGFLTPHGRARNLRRTVSDPGGLLDWISDAPSSRRIRERCMAFVYSTDPADLVTTVLAHGHAAGLEYVFTGVAAARVLNVAATTSIPVAMVRVDPDVPVDEACSMLEAEPVDRGANLMVVRDIGRLGVHRRDFYGPAPLASPVRIWLDMLGEQRGQDAAMIFRETFIGW